MDRRFFLVPLPIALAVYAVLAGVLVHLIVGGTGEMTYTMDDVYIHMALAKNLALHGVYGVTPFEVTNASSSPLWVLLLAAGFLLLGPTPLMALVLAVLSGALLLFAADRVLREAQRDEGSGSVAIRLGALLGLVALVPLAPLAVSGMEHLLHGAAMIVAAWWIARLACDPRPIGAARLALLAALFFLLPLLRYESLWLAVLAAAVLVARRRYGLAGLVLGSSIGAVVLAGVVALACGQTFLPAPIVTKSVGPLLLGEHTPLALLKLLVAHPLYRLFGSLWLLPVLWVTALGLLIGRMRRSGRIWQPVTVLLGFFVAGTWVHATFATFGWGARYEAYLVALGVVAIAAGAGSWLAEPSRSFRLLPASFAAVAAVLVAVTGGVRTATTFAKTPMAAEEVFNRDVFVARFLAREYPRQGVVAMNIGAIVWNGEPHLVDVLALGSPGLLHEMLERRFSVDSLLAAATRQDATIAVVFDDWFTQWTGGRLPWIAVARVDAGVPRPLIYTLYARDAAAADRLAGKLRRQHPAPPFKVRIALLPPYDGR